MRTPGTTEAQKQLDESHKGIGQLMVDALKANVSKKGPGKPESK
jgi:hypothetical protein